MVNLLNDAFVTITIWVGVWAYCGFLWIKFPWENKARKHLLLEIAFLLVWPVCIMLFSIYLTRIIVSPDVFRDQAVGSLLTAIIITFCITAIHEAHSFYRQWKEHFNKSVKLERANLEAKYETLKTQINPHFLFNSLNILLSYVEDNPRASEYVQNLSDFMRYVLKNREKEVALLKDELDVAKKYCYLQKSRFGDNLLVDFNVPGEYLAYNILPLSLQMLIENSIKHNIISKDRPLNIRVFVNSNHCLVVENNLQKKSDTPSTGLGLANILERYKFLTTKIVEISETSSKFAVALPLVATEL